MARYNDYNFDLLDRVIMVNPDSQEDFIHSENDIVVEVGCGNGHFLTGLATEEKDKTFYGIDIKSERLIRCTEKKIKAELQNIGFICGDAMNVLPKKFADKSIKKIFMTFPDPWPKNRHHKNRLFKPDFLDIVYAKLSDDGEFIFITDFEDYYIWSKSFVEADSRFTITTASKDDQNNQYLTKSLFGQKWEKEQRSYYVLQFKKV